MRLEMMRNVVNYSYPCLKIIAETHSHSELTHSPSLVLISRSKGNTPLICGIVTSQNEKTSLLGKTKQDYASIVRWMSFANQEILPPLGNAIRPLVGKDPYNRKNVDEALKAAMKAASVLNDHLVVHTFLVGERITLADLFAAGILSRGFQYFFDKQWRADNPNVARWYVGYPKIALRTGGANH